MERLTLCDARATLDQVCVAEKSAMDNLATVLTQLENAQLVRRLLDPPPTYRFKHALIRDTAYQSLLISTRRAIHLQVGQVLETEHGDSPVAVPELSLHFFLGGDLERALPYSVQAAEQAERHFAHEEALLFYGRARECAETLNLPEQITRIDEAIGEVYLARGQYETAVEHYQRALGGVTVPNHRAALKAKIGRSYATVGDERGVAFLKAAVSELDPERQTNELAEATTMLGRYHLYREEHLKAIEFLERARQLGEPLDNPETLTAIYVYLHDAYADLLRFDQSLEWGHQCVALGERKNHPLALAAGYECLAESSRSMGRWQEALTFAARNREIAENIGDQFQMAWAEYNCAGALHGLGDLPTADQAARTALALTATVRGGFLDIMVRATLAMVQTDLGTAEAGRVEAERAVVRADELGHRWVRALSRRALAYWHVQVEEWERAGQLCEQCIELIEGTTNRWLPLLLGALRAEAYSGQGRLGEADKIIAEHLAVAQEAQTRQLEGLGWRILGQIRRAQRQWGNAEEAFGRAITILEEGSSRLEVGRALYQRGMMWQQRGEIASAHVDLQRAQTIFEKCRALRDRTHTQERLR